MLYKKLFNVLVLFAVPALFIIGCSESDNGLSSDFSTYYESADYAVLDFNDAIDAIVVPDFDNEPGFGPFPGPPEGFEGDGRGGRRGGRHFGPGHRGPHGNGNHLGRILSQLNLSEDQKTEIDSYLEAHREVMTALFDEFKEAASEIMDYARDQRQSIMDQVRNNEITREEARELMKQLGDEIKEMIAQDEEVSLIRAEMCAARDQLFDNISAVLNEDQLDIWNQWIADHPGVCE